MFSHVADLSSLKTLDPALRLRRPQGDVGERRRALRTLSGHTHTGHRQDAALLLAGRQIFKYLLDYQFSVFADISQTVSPFIIAPQKIVNIY